MAEIVVDASAIVDLPLGNELGGAVGRRLAGHALHATAHLDPRFSPLGAGCMAQATPRPKTSSRRCKGWPVHRSSGTVSVDLLVDSWVRRHQLARRCLVHPVGGLALTFRWSPPIAAFVKGPLRTSSSRDSRPARLPSRLHATPVRIATGDVSQVSARASGIHTATSESPDNSAKASLPSTACQRSRRACPRALIQHPRQQAPDPTSSRSPTISGTGGHSPSRSTCVKGHWFLPSGGQETCPVAVTSFARWWPWVLHAGWPPRLG